MRRWREHADVSSLELLPHTAKARTAFASVQQYEARKQPAPSHQSGSLWSRAVITAADVMKHTQVATPQDALGI